MKKSAHQIWKEVKDKNLSHEETKALLKKEGVIVPLENIERQHEIANNILKRIKTSR